MPLETAEALAERLLVLTLMLETAAIEDLTPLLTERARIVAALETVEKGPEIRETLVKVMHSEHRALQKFAAERAETARDMDRRHNGRRLPSTYSLSRQPGLMLDSAG